MIAAGKLQASGSTFASSTMRAVATEQKQLHRDAERADKDKPERRRRKGERGHLDEDDPWLLVKLPGTTATAVAAGDGDEPGAEGTAMAGQKRRRAAAKAVSAVQDAVEAGDVSAREAVSQPAEVGSRTLAAAAAKAFSS